MTNRQIAASASIVRTLLEALPTGGRTTTVLGVVVTRWDPSFEVGTFGRTDRLVSLDAAAAEVVSLATNAGRM